MNKYLFEMTCTICKDTLDTSSVRELEYTMGQHDEVECKPKEIDNSKYNSGYYISIPGMARYRDEIDSALEELVSARQTIADDIYIKNSIDILNDLRLELDDMIEGN